VQKDLVLLGANAPEMELLRARLTRIGHRVVPVKTAEQAHAFLRVGGPRVGAVAVPTDLPVVNLRAALEVLRRLAPGSDFTFIGAVIPGRPGASACATPAFSSRSSTPWTSTPCAFK